jgi:hypothetical protein
MHHNSERLYVINNLRFYPLIYAIDFSLSIFPAMLLGFTPQAIPGCFAFTQPVLMLQHANIDLRNGLLNYVFSTNELHHWHHSVEPGVANSNYGTVLVFWDQLFGTFHTHPCKTSRCGLFYLAPALPIPRGPVTFPDYARCLRRPAAARNSSIARHSHFATRLRPSRLATNRLLSARVRNAV